MSINLNQPLRKKSSQKIPFYIKVISRFGFCLLFSICVIGLSIHIIISDSLNGIVSETDQYYFIPEGAKETTTSALNKLANVEPPKNIVETLKDDNNKVSIITNNINRPVSVIDPLRINKEKFISVIHKNGLITNKSRGFLSVQGNKSSTSFEDYTKYCPNSNIGSRIAIVVSGLGISKTGTQRAINLLPANVTLAFASDANSVKHSMETAIKKGQETILQIPMQDFTVSNDEDDPYVLKVNQSPKVLSNRIYNSLNRATKYYGIMNYRGSSFLSDKDSIIVLFNELAKRKLFFVDDGSVMHSNITQELADSINLPYVLADLYLGYQVDRNNIRKKLKDLEYKARVTGKAIIVAVSFDENIEEILKWLKEDYMKDISIVPLSCLIKSSTKYT